MNAKHALTTLFSFLFILCLSIGAFAQSVQYDQQKVAKIDIQAENVPTGTAFNASTVRAKMQTKAGNLFSQNEFDRDLKMLVEEYDRVEPVIQVINNELYITLKVWIKSKVRAIIFEGNDNISSKKLRGEIEETEVGKPFERDTFIKELNEIKIYYIKKGYFEAQIDYELVPVPETNEVDVKVIIKEGRSGKIKGIEFEGFTKKEEKELLEEMVTKKYNFLLSWYTGKGCYHPDMVEHDQMTIVSYLQNKGYADATVTIDLNENDANKVILTIRADKGLRYNFGTIKISGNTIFDDNMIWDQFEFYCGGCYSPENMRLTNMAIRDLYGTCGYIDAHVDIQLCLREDACVYDVIVTIEEGQPFSVGMVRVFGNTCTQTRVILHECLLCPGDTFDINRIEATETRLLNTGYFSNVNVYAVRSPDEDLNMRDVYIEVEETDTGNLGIFCGFSSLENVFAGIDITESNFNLLGIPQVLSRGPRALRGAGEFLHLKTNFGTRETNYLLQWTKPYFLDTPWIVGFDLEKTDNRLLSRGYEIKTWGGNVHATYIFNEFVKYDLHYRGIHTRVAVKDKNNPILDQESRISGFVSAVGTTIIYDSTDHPRRPSSGFRSRFLTEVAGVGGNFEFWKFAYLNSYYYPMWRNGVLKFRADCQFIATYGNTRPDTLPLSERLYMGGETTVRGYRNFIIGPKFGNNEPAGGVSSYLLSEEYQHHLLDMPCTDAFLFVDAGYVSPREFRLGKPAASVGFGLRIEVMRNMPMTFGMGFPIHPTERINGEPVDNTQRFFFSMGGCF
jgi:outer membrane protein insertion porin family